MSQSDPDLTDREAVNEAVAEGLGWTFYHAQVKPHRFWFTASGQRSPVGGDPPPFLSDDPHLNAEMEKALRAVAERGAAVWRATHGWCMFVTRRGQTTAGDWMPTKAAALVLALAACEIVELPKEGHG